MLQLTWSRIPCLSAVLLMAGLRMDVHTVHSASAQCHVAAVAHRWQKVLRMAATTTGTC
jgi:hypothetical protein